MAVTLAKMFNPGRWAGTSGARVADKWGSIQCHSMPDNGVGWYAQHTEINRSTKRDQSISLIQLRLSSVHRHPTV
ncbi:hypothetical protein RRF57_011884 [Xylaria bambusicola]|uniref:Uncharacterized protein n=1 Tax=Xylaria bambusicola TaxID=326684 RepID=A0AAN7ZAA6_9PEZI